MDWKWFAALALLAWILERVTAIFRLVRGIETRQAQMERGMAARYALQTLERAAAEMQQTEGAIRPTETPESSPPLRG
jgi:hypothetical protein